ncbi:hypothetical protein N431DRAFT_460073 [Stipitochalara longipes BDJ]|nr:hypothetical protein N431DRAFT_460073 [Stipitochalara longipes BDJ]
MRIELEAQVEKHDEDMQKLKIQFAEKNNLSDKELIALKNAYKEIEAERMKATDGHRKFMSTNTALKATNEDLRKKWASARFKFEQVEKELETLRKDKHTQDLIIGEVRRQAKENAAKRKRLESASEAAERKLNTAERELSSAETRISQQDATIKDLKLEVSKLEMDRDLKAPLLQIGVEIRLRNLEHARETLLEVPRGEINKAIIMNGNLAAHSAIGAVDAAMFKADLVPENFVEEATKVFKKMYQIEPSRYGIWCPKVLRLMDCRATVNTVKAFRGRNASADLRDERCDVDNRLIELHNSLGQREFETNEEVDELIQRLELLTTEIVQVDRSRGGRH